MSSLQEVIGKLRKNSKEHYKEVERLLVKIAENILKDPDNVKIRTLRKNNTTVSQKILKSPGGLECLLLMGFRETENDFTLPRQAPLQNLQLIKDSISTENVFREIKQEAVLQKVQLPPLVTRYQNKFLQEIEERFHKARVHDDETLHKQAKELIVEAQIEMLAIERMRTIQKRVIAGDIEDPNISMQEVLLLELLAWFKNDFFSWVDSPACENCGGKTTFSNMSTDSELLKYTDRVEMFNCQKCNASTPFPRFNDLNILLATRKGRCGEWANTFTLFCRAMGWDARYVFDETDHVWTEVYSIVQKRWLHCDPCENVCDAPLIYESGWNKKLSYIIAYSGEEVQDVTWRYSSDHKEVLKRRNKCSEKELVEAIVSLRLERQEALSENRKTYLNKRVLSELVELMVEKQPSDSEQKGRSSGSVAWRLARGETQSLPNHEGHIFKIGALDENFVKIAYCTALDQYEIKSNIRDHHISNFANGVLNINGVFRKEEKDWKTVYLCRKETANIGTMTWAFQIESDQKSIEQISVYFDYRTFETGNVKVILSNKHKQIELKKEQKKLATMEFANEKYFEVSAELTGGKGNVYWQHAQLFRQSLDSTEHSFVIEIKLK